MKYGMAAAGALVLSFLTCSLSLRAADRFWIDTTGGNFTDKGNWSGGIVPGMADNANFNLGIPPYAVSFTSSVTNANAFCNFTNGLVTFNIGAANRWRLTNSFVVGRRGSTTIVSLTTGTLVVTNSAGTARLIAGQNGKGTFILSGGTIATDQLYATNVSAGVINSVFGFGHGTLTINKGSVIKTENSDFQIGASSNRTATLNILGGTNIFNTGSAVATVLGGAANLTSIVNVTGLGTIWANTGRLEIGRNSDNNRLLITDGARVTNTYANIGNTFSQSNLVAVSGDGSFWTNDIISVGAGFSSGNRLVITNGGIVDGHTILVGNGGHFNRAVIAGNASSRAAVFLGVGLSGGASNSLLVTEGAQIFSGHMSIGEDPGSAGNHVTVDGANTFCRVADDLTNGHFGDYNSLRITNGGRVTNNAGLVGSWGNSNIAIVVGPNSHWINRTDLNIGSFGDFNTLCVLSGGMVASDQAYIGGGYAWGNSVLVSGIGSRWTNVNALIIGHAGGFNSLTISNGGTVIASDAILGFGVFSSSNIAIITGANSLWKISERLSIGVNGSFNTLRLSSGATVIAETAVIGSSVHTGSTNNRIINNGGSLLLTNSGFGSLGIDDGTNRLESGLIDVDRLIMTETSGVFEFNGGKLVTRRGTIANSQPFVVGASGSVPAIWDVREGMSKVIVSSALTIGQSVAGCQLLVTNGQTLQCDPSPLSILGGQVAASNTLAVISGTGSYWINASDLRVGNFSARNRMMISGGASVKNRNGSIGHFSSSESNEVTVTGSSSFWRNDADLQVGCSGAGNRLVIANSGAVLANNVYVGLNSGSSNNVLDVGSGAKLIVTNAGGTSTLDVRRGQFNLNAGNVLADRLVATLGEGSVINFPAGLLSVGSSSISNNQPFAVANGTSEARLVLMGNDTHRFGEGIIIRGRGTLAGNGTITGGLTVENGGTLSPGQSVGELFLSQSPVLQGTTVMEISRNGLFLTNDQVQVAGPLTYGGRLTVTRIGATALSGGDRFRLFSASGYSGSFSPITLPSLPAGLSWTNRLLLDGSIEVVNRLKIASIELLNGNVVIRGTGGAPNGDYYVLRAINVALPLASWSRISTNQFDGSGGFMFSRAVDPGIPEQFFTVQLP